MKKWEYKTHGYEMVSTLEQIHEFQKRLKELGDEGWELVSTIGDNSRLFIFKRPVKKVSETSLVGEQTLRKFTV